LRWPGEVGFEPRGKVVIHKQVQFKMHVRPVLCDDLGVGRAAHRGNEVAGLWTGRRFSVRTKRAQVRVKRINFNAPDEMADDDVIA